MLQHLQARANPSIMVDTLSIARATQDKLGVTIQDLQTKPEIVPSFQDELLSAKTKHVRKMKRLYAETHEVIVTDRTPVDIFCYAHEWVSAHPEFNEWLDAYRLRCIEALSDYDMVVLVPIRKFPFVAEQQRATIETQRSHSRNCKNFARSHARDVRMIRQLDVQKRVDELLTFKEECACTFFYDLAS